MDFDAAEWEPGTQPVHLETTRSEIEAEMLVGFLRANGVRAFGQNESSHGLSHYGGQAARSSALSLYRIYVHPDDEAAGRTLLESDEGGGGEDGGETRGSGEAPEGDAYELDEDPSAEHVLAAPSGRPWVVGVTLVVLAVLAAAGADSIRTWVEKLF